MAMAAWVSLIKTLWFNLDTDKSAEGLGMSKAKRDSKDSWLHTSHNASDFHNFAKILAKIVSQGIIKQ